MSKYQRAKGARGEHAARLLFEERDWEIHKRPRGEAGDDFVGIDKDGKAWSIEVKNTKSATHAHICQARRNAPKGRGFILCWHPSSWGLPANLWVLFFFPNGDKPYVRSWTLNENQ